MSNDCTDNWCMDDTPHPAHPSELRVWADKAELFIASQKARIAELEAVTCQPYLDRIQEMGAKIAELEALLRRCKMGVLPVSVREAVNAALTPEKPTSHE